MEYHLNKIIKKIDTKMTKAGIEKLLAPQQEYVNLSIKVPAEKKAELLEKINEWLNKI